MSHTPPSPDEKLVLLYQRVADLTLSHCARTCRNVGSCCSKEYCEIAIDIAREEWGTDLPPTGHPTLPLLDPVTNKCTAPPHTRPLCTMHSCDISAVGYFKGDMPLTKRYYKLREKAGELECKRNS